MPLLNTADAVHLGTQTVDAVYLGATKVWPPPPTGAWGPDEGIYLSSTTPAVNGSYPNTFVSGNDIYVVVDGRITGLRYWHIAGTLTSRLVSLWTNTGTLLARVNHTGAVDGWNTVSITPIAVTAGSEYRVVIGQSGSGVGDGWPYTNSSYTSASPHLTWMAGVYSVDTPEGGEDDFPDTTTSLYHYFTDLVFQAQAAPPAFSPADLAGLNVWLDAAQLGLADGAAVTTWPNLGSGPTPTIVAGTPSMLLKASTLNGQPVVRFTANGSRVRSPWTGANGIFAWTVIYIVRFWGANVGRAFTVQYPPSNLLIGMHSSMMDTMYNNGTWVPASGVGWPGPGPLPWRMYEADGDSAQTSRFYINGVLMGSASSGYGFNVGWALSGYDPTGVQETMDIDVAELLIYDRKLSDAERIQVEDYLRDKWGLA